MRQLIEKLTPILKPHGIHPEDFILECVEECVLANPYGRREMNELPCIEAIEWTEEDIGKQIEEALWMDSKE